MGVRSIVFVQLLGLTCSWVIWDNCYHSYFNLYGDVASSLNNGANVSVNGREFVVKLAQIAAGNTTYVQLDADHGAKVGDKVTLAGDDDEDSSSDSSSDVNTDDFDDEDTGASTSAESEKAPAEEGDFSAEFPFSDAVSVEEVKLQVQELKKPAMVIVTQPWCGACKGLKRSMNDNVEQLRGLMGEFVVVHAAAEAGNEWQAPGQNEGYIPRVYFLDQRGDFLPVAGPNEDYKHFFQDVDALEKGMRAALKHDSKEDEL